MKYLSPKQLEQAMLKHPYLLLRFASGYQMGINSKILPILKRNMKKNVTETAFVSFQPCDLNEYITHKHPFY